MAWRAVRKYVLLLSATIAIVFSYFVLTSVGAIPENNIKLLIYDHWYASIKHPEQSRQLNHFREFGNFGNSNHCDFAAGDFRTTTLSKKELEDFYKTQSMKSFRDSPPEIEVWTIKDLEDVGYPQSDWLRNSGLSASTTKNIYLVVAVDQMYYPGWDYRCH